MLSSVSVEMPSSRYRSCILSYNLSFNILLFIFFRFYLKQNLWNFAFGLAKNERLKIGSAPKELVPTKDLWRLLCFLLRSACWPG